MAGGREVDRERRDLLAFHDRQAAPRGAKRVAIVARVELASELRGPPRIAAKRGKQRGRPLDDRHIDRLFQPGDGQIPARHALEKRRRQPNGEKRQRSGGLVADRFERGGVGLAQAARDGARWRAGGRGHEHEPDAAMNRKHAAVVVEAHDRIHVAARQQPSPQRSAAAIRAKTRREDEADAPAVAREIDGALDEQLIAVGVPVRLGAVAARLAGELHERRQVGPRPRSRRRGPHIRAHHVPRWVADHGVETGIVAAPAVRVEEGFGKLQLPVEETPASG